MNPKSTLKLACGLIAMVAAFGLAPEVQADTLLTATIGSDSSAFSSGYAASNLFDGSPTLGATSGLGNEYAAAGEENPVITFDLGASTSLSGIDYAERQDAQNPPGDGGSDGVAAIDLYFVSKSTYNSFTPTDGSTPADVTLALGMAPSEVITIPTEAQPNLQTGSGDTIIPTSLAFNNYTFTSGPASTEYVIAQFIGVNQDPGQGIPANPGGAELRFVEAATPEPTTYALLGLGFAGLVWTLRSRRSSEA